MAPTLNLGAPVSAVFGALSPERDFVPAPQFSVLSGIFGGGLAPQGQPGDYAVISMRVPRHRFDLSSRLIAEDHLVQVKVVTTGDDTSTIEDTEAEIAEFLNGATLQAWDDGPLYLCLASELASPILPEVRDGVTYRAVGRDYILKNK